MSTVPNWIAKGYVMTGYGPDRRIYPVISWRATATQVVVLVEMNHHRTEMRFYLDTLQKVGSGNNSIKLVAPGSEAVREVSRVRTIRETRDRLDKAIDEHQQLMRSGTHDVERVVASISNVQRAATKAMADLADLL